MRYCMVEDIPVWVLRREPSVLSATERGIDDQNKIRPRTDNGERKNGQHRKDLEPELFHGENSLLFSGLFC
jgi:hypothetical protein